MGETIVLPQGFSLSWQGRCGRATDEVEDRRQREEEGPVRLPKSSTSLPPAGPQLLKLLAPNGDTNWKPATM